MKKLLALALVVFGLAACQTEPEGFDVTVNGEVPVTVTVDLADAVGTRANSAEGAIDNAVVTSDDYTLRYALQVFNENGTASKDIKYKYTDATSVAFDLRLVPNRNYKFVVWADIVDAHQTLTEDVQCADLHYAIGADLRHITLNNSIIAWKAMDETRDAYTGVYDANNFNAAQNITIELTRPFAKLRVVTTDIAELFDGVVPAKAEATYTTKHRASFNAFTQKAGEAELPHINHTFNIAGYNEGEDANANNKTLFVDYFFAADQDDVVNFTLDVKEANGTTIKSNTFNTPIPVKRNFLTTIKGNILTEGSNINVDIDDNFGENQENQENWGTISSQAELDAAVENGGKYIVIADIDINNGGAGTTAVRFAATGAAVETIIDLNGYTITAKNTGTDALITVEEGNTLTFTGSGTIKLTDDSTGSFIKVEDGAKVNIEGATLEDDNQNVDIFEGEGNVVDYVAELKKAFEDGDGSEYILPTDVTLSEPLVLADDKTLTLNLNGKTIKQSQAQTGAYSMITNKGTLTIKGNGTIDYADTADLTADVNYVSNVIQNYGVLTIEDATIINSSTDSVADYGFPHCIDNSGTLTINSGTLTNKTKYSSIRIWCTTDDDTIVTINGGTFNGCIDFQTVNGNANKGTLTINNGVFNAEKNAVRLLGFGVDVYELNGYIKGGVFNGDITLRNYVGGEFNSQVFFISGGTFSNDPSAFVAEGYEAAEQNGVWTIRQKPSVAKVGNTEYFNIDTAIANWKNNTTLTLLADVTLSDVVTIKSTEHHILDLGTYTMTAAEGKNAFVITACGTGDAERYAITIKADAENPGGINAGNKCVVYYKYADGGISTNDRPIIKIEGGVFTGSTSSWGTAGFYTIGTAARKCATFNISGGTFNCSINGSGKSKLLISGGVFNYSVGSQGDSTANRLIWGGRFKTLGFMTADSNNTKFWFGTSMGNSNVGLYIDDENYLVVGGPVITDFGDKFAAKITDPTKWSTYLQYSSAATYGLYYTNAELAIEKHKDNVITPQ